jgi:hypothetical protein
MATSIPIGPGEIVVPLEFLRRKGTGNQAQKGVLPTPVPIPQAVPEEAVAQVHQLRLNYAAKTSTGVRLQGGPNVMNTLGHMLDGMAESDVEVVPARETTLTVASPHIIRTQEAGEWLRAHGEASPITRHALYVLELLDAIDPAYDTFAGALIDGEVDTSGYPEYSAIVGGIAAHWDEATGDLIVRGVVGWGGRGTRGDTASGRTWSVRWTLKRPCSCPIRRNGYEIQSQQDAMARTARRVCRTVTGGCRCLLEFLREARRGQRRGAGNPAVHGPS